MPDAEQVNTQQANNAAATAAPSVRTDIPAQPPKPEPKPYRPPPVIPVTTTDPTKLPSAPAAGVTDKNLVKTAAQQAADAAGAAAKAATEKAAADKKTADVAAQPKPVKVYDNATLLPLIEKNFVSVENLAGTGSFYPFRGVCKQCGWQTHQLNRDDAFALTRTHAMKHWQEAVRLDGGHASAA
jgi:hypothetical protein